MIDRALIGIDGGGSKTLALLADGDGTVVARAQAGGSNQNVVGPEAAAAAIGRSIVECCETAGIPVSHIADAVIGLAGAGSPQDRSALIRLVRSHLGPGEHDAVRFTIETDTRIALEGAFDGGPGIVVIAGTGSAVIAKTVGGELMTVGGWGRTLGDEGSGFYLGRGAVRALLRAFDAGTAPGSLEKAVMSATKSSTRDEIIAAVYRKHLSLPSLAPLVLRAADDGDAVALEILRGAAALLADQVAVPAGRPEWVEPPGVVFVGSLIDAGGIYARALETAIRERVPRTRIHAPLRTPAEGAVLMARNTVKGRAS
jgi:glucosamine kinase